MLSRQVSRYILVGIVGTVTHLAILVIVVEWFGFDVILGTTVGFLGALIISFILNHRWTFQSERSYLSSLWRYVTVSLSGLLINTVMMYTLVSIFHWWYITAQLSVILVVPVCNYLLNRYWAFTTNPN